MTVVVLGLDALDPDLVDEEHHPNLVLEDHSAIDTIVSTAGKPSTHELWPTIITGLTPEEHGLQVKDGVAWDNPLLRTGSDVADRLLPDGVQTQLGAWLLNNTAEDAFRTSAGYYEKRGLTTVFDGYESLAIGVPNYVTDTDTEDREHLLRRQLGDLFERDPEARGGHISADPATFFERCLEMLMVRLARVRRALRSRRYQLVFGYTSALDLVGHVAYADPELQERAYEEADEFIGELLGDLEGSDELLLVSDHGLQDGVHTDEAMVASTNREIVEDIESVVDVRGALETELQSGDHTAEPRIVSADGDAERGREVRQQLEDLGYM